MITGIYQSIIMLAGIIAPFYLVDTYFHHKYDPRRENKENGNKTGRSWVIMGGSLVVVGIVLAQPVIWPNLSFTTDARWGLGLQLTGLLISAMSAFLNGWARDYLGTFYVQGSKIQSDHRLIDTGPYSLARHPIFTAYLLLVTALIFVNPSLITMPLAVCVYFYLRMWTIRDETSLIVQFGTQYTDYAKQTNRYIPSLRSVIEQIKTMI